MALGTLFAYHNVEAILSKKHNIPAEMFAGSYSHKLVTRFQISCKAAEK